MPDERSHDPMPLPAPRDAIASVSTGDGRLQPLRRLTRRRLPWRWLGAAGAVALAAVLGKALFQTRPVEVELGTVTRGTVRVSVGAEGRTRIVHRHVLAAPVTGALARIMVRAGDSVSVGDTVAALTATTAALLDPRSRELAVQRFGAASAMLSQARAAASRAVIARSQTERDVARTRALEAAGAVPAQQVEQMVALLAQRTEDAAAATAGVLAAVHEVAAARTSLASFTSERSPGSIAVTAPMTGVVLRVMKEDEGVVPAGTPLLEIGDPATLEVVTDVLSEDAVRLSAGATARVTVAGGDTLRGTVQRVEPQAFTRRSSLGVDEQRVRVVIRLVELTSRVALLGDGFRVDVDIDQASTASGVTVMPSGALIRHTNAWAVFVYRDARARLVPVTVGLRNALQAEIRSGLTIGDRVVLYPTDVVTDGGRVTPSNP